MVEDNERMQRELHAAIEHVLTTDHGRRLIFWLLGICGVYEDGFVMDNNLTNYRLGRQAVGKQIIAQMNAIDAALYPRFLLECAKLQEREMNNE